MIIFQHAALRFISNRMKNNAVLDVDFCLPFCVFLTLLWGRNIIKDHI